MTALSDFLALYPKDGPDAGTGPFTRKVCVCGHEFWKHTLGACLVVVNRRYCPCLDGAHE